MNHPVCLIVGLHVCAMDCNPRVQLIHICVLVEVWTASKVPHVLFRSTQMIDLNPEKKDEAKCKEKHKN